MKIVLIIILCFLMTYILTLLSLLPFSPASGLDSFHQSFQKTNHAFFIFLTSPLIREYSGEFQFHMMSFTQWLNSATPLIFTGLAIALILKSGILNLGAEGQLFAGAVAGSLFAVIPNINGFIHIIIIFIAAAAAGSLWAVLPAYASIKKKDSEILVSLMMNYLAFYLGIYLIKTLIRDQDSGGLMSVKFSPSAILPLINERYRLHMGIIVACLTAVLFGFLIKKTKWGLKIKMIGSNLNFAEYSGIDVKRQLFKVQLISGAIAGSAGIFELIGYHQRFLWQTTPGYGWDGVIVAIMASKNPFYVPFSALFLAYIRVGAQNMGRYSDVSPQLVKIIQGIIILFLAAEGLFKSRPFSAYQRKKRGIQDV
ncbi:MAG TPA: ABC transporter permease [Thermotogota bacterium]|nr:ABC transporter permease [Thermotogota bacterium]HRW34293.1 ABC transporter permease [Thermotogota bacterium]